MAGKVKAYKRQHKAARIKALLEERAAASRAAEALDRKLGRSRGKADAPFRGCVFRDPDS